MLFSVIVPFLNEEKYIERCARSLICQNFDRDKYEIIFIDNGSTDKSVEIVSKFPEIILLFEKFPNVYAARNKGIRIARGKFIVFTDGDCVVNKSWLKSFYQVLQDDEVAVVLGKRDFPNKDQAVLQIFAGYENEKVRYVLKNCLRNYWFGYTNNLVIRRSVLRSLKGFKLYKVNGDVDLVQRVLKVSGKTVSYCPRAVIIHLEIESLWIWIKKVYSYGYHNTVLTELTNFKNLFFRDNLGILRSFARKKKLGLGKFWMAMGCLALGFTAYKLGSIKAVFWRSEIVEEW